MIFFSPRLAQIDQHLMERGALQFNIKEIPTKGLHEVSLQE